MDRITNQPVPVLLDRCTTLSALVGETKETYPFKFRGTMRQLPLVHIRLDLPVYRVGNHRTKTLQEEYLAIHSDLPENFFRVDTDSTAVQEAQRALLDRLVNQQGLFETFKKADGEQEEPILCTRDGTVVNGNRRLCAWRKLYAEDPVQYKRYESVAVALLPHDCTEDDIDEIERELQIKQTHRAEYSWHTKAAMIKEMFDTGKHGKAHIAALFDMKPSEIDLVIDCLECARQHLANIGHPGEWSRVDKDEFAFRKIVAAEKAIRDEGQKDVFGACAAALLQATSAEVGDRKYNLIPKLAENIQAVTEVLTKEVLPPGTSASSQRALAMKAAAACRKEENLDKTVEIIKNVLDAADEKASDRQKGVSLLTDLTDISTRLLTAKTRDLDDRQQELAAALKQADAILETAMFIKHWIEHHAPQG